MSGVVKIEITESAEKLHKLLTQATTAHSQERLQVLYWLKTQKVETVEESAVLLGRHRVTVQRWLSRYRAGGIQGLLEKKKSPGRPKSIPECVVARLKQELEDPEGFRSYIEVQLWLKTCCSVDVAYRTVHQLVRYRLQGKLKVPRPVSAKQREGQIEEFKKNCQNS